MEGAFIGRVQRGGFENGLKRRLDIGTDRLGEFVEMTGRGGQYHVLVSARHTQVLEARDGRALVAPNIKDLER